MSDKNKKINKILEELYDLDPELKKREKELRKAIIALIELKPETELDQEFSQELKGELLNKFSGQKEKRTFFLFSRWTWVPLGTAAIILIIATSVLLSELYPSQQKVAQEDGMSRTSLQLEQLGDRAFGSITLQVQEPKDFGVDGGGQLSREAEGLGGGSEEDSTSSDSPDNKASVSVIPNRINYEFVYAGEELELEAEERNVFKRIKDDSLSRKLAGQFGDLDLGLMDWGRLQNKKIKNLNLTEDRKFGFSIDFNLDNNEVSLSKNWSKWPDPFWDCGGDSECLEGKQLNLEDIPPEEELVAITDDFLRKYGVDISHYGQGRVQEYWTKTLDLSQDKENFRVPDSISVVYPLKIDNKTVYQRGGDSEGLRVNVDIRHRRVSGLNNFYLPKFQSSSYPAITDPGTIVSRAEKGGLDRPYDHSEPTKTVRVELGTPSSELVKTYNRKEDTKEAEELYVPAYVFPITKVSEKTHYLKERIVIPVIQGMWQEPDRPDIGIPEER